MNPNATTTTTTFPSLAPLGAGAVGDDTPPPFPPQGLLPFVVTYPLTTLNPFGVDHIPAPMPTVGVFGDGTGHVEFGWHDASVAEEDSDSDSDDEEEHMIPFISLVTCLNDINAMGDFQKKKQFLKTFLGPGNPLGFTFTGSCPIDVRHERSYGTYTRGICLFYTRHISKGPHNCDDCDVFCIKMTTYLKLLIKYKTPRKTEFSKEDYTQLDNFFTRLFNAMRLVTSDQRSITKLQEYFERVPNWFETFQTKFASATFERDADAELLHPVAENAIRKMVAENIEAQGVALSPEATALLTKLKLDGGFDEAQAQEEDEDEDEDEEDEKQDADEKQAFATVLAMVEKDVEKSGKPMPSKNCKHIVLKSFQTLLRMTAIPSILLAIPQGCVNPYAQYIESFVKSVDVYKMLYACKAGIPQIGNGNESSSSSSSAAAASVSASLDDEDDESFMGTFDKDEDNNNIFCLAARRCSMTGETVNVDGVEKPFEEVACDPQSKKAVMKAVLQMFFDESIAMHVDRLNDLTGYEDMFTGEKVIFTPDMFKDLFDVYVDLKVSSAPNFTLVDDKCLVKLAYLAECIGDRKMAFQIIGYFLSYRFEYMAKAWKIEMPKLEEDLQMPVHFLTAEQWRKKWMPDDAPAPAPAPQ